MDMQLIIHSIFSGLKPVFPLLAVIFFLSILIALYRNKVSKKRLFVSNDFKAVNLLNKSEIKVYEALVEYVQVASNNKYRVFAQVSLGEILRNRDRSSFNRINQKRADFA